MIVAALVASGIGQVFDGALLIVIFAISGALEAFVTRRTADSVAALLDLAPQQATQLRAHGGEDTVDTAELVVGDVVLVRPGERVGADGRVVDGASEVDQASITGEPLPVLKQAGDEVFAGTANGTGALQVRVTRPAHDSVVARNTVRAHRGLDGQTPLARWCEDATPLREVPAESLRWMLMADVERTINKDGVHFERVRFIAPELNGLVGERVQVRYTPHDLRRIEIFRGDTWLCTAYPQDELTAEQRAAVLARRHADASRAGPAAAPHQPSRPRPAGPDHRTRAGRGHHGDHRRAGPPGTARAPRT